VNVLWSVIVARVDVVFKVGMLVQWDRQKWKICRTHNIAVINSTEALPVSFWYLFGEIFLTIRCWW